MKTLHYSIIAIIGITAVSLACSQIEPVSAYHTVVLDTGIPPIIITQVELWGPISFYSDGVKSCRDENTSLGPWAIGWMELYNTKNETMLINDIKIQGAFGEGGYPQ